MSELICVTTPRQMPPVHPGTILRDDVLPALNISVSQAAKELGLSRQTLHRILAGDLGVSTGTALRLGKWCGNGAGLWVRLQQAYDLWHMERAMSAELDAVPSRLAA
ncbi:MAG: HigA family addiction module antitoxin [Sphingomonadaceae bacterium]